jgi:hypothetical protein
MKYIFVYLKNISFALTKKKLFFLQIRTLCFKSNYENNLIIPLIVYNNIEAEKISILKNNKGKTGIYR